MRFHFSGAVCVCACGKGNFVCVLFGGLFTELRAKTITTGSSSSSSNSSSRRWLKSSSSSSSSSSRGGRFRQQQKENIKTKLGDFACDM